MYLYQLINIPMDPPTLLTCHYNLSHRANPLLCVCLHRTQWSQLLEQKLRCLGSCHWKSKESFTVGRNIASFPCISLLAMKPRGGQALDEVRKDISELVSQFSFFLS